MAINILDSMIINRISAGEVVESPFSIVKELIDNSLDAGANKITIEIKNGGIDQIIVKDNGKGIDYDDIKKAFLPHATSKISSLEDLDSISTLGFRGEALASISNVSQTIIITKTENNDCAYTLEVNGGKFGQIEPSVAGNGTKITVLNLFYNTPARRKFLRKPKLEESQITNIVARYILANPTIEFRYIADDKTIYSTKGKTLLDAIKCVYGDEITQNIMYIEKTDGNITVNGYVSKIGFSRPNTTYQTLMINSRYVIDEIVSKAVYMAQADYLMTRQFPFYVLNLTIPNVEVDVNVHPSKLNVKFSSPSKIYDLVYSAVRSAVYRSLNPMSSEKPLSSNPLINVNEDSIGEVTIEPNTISSINGDVNLKPEEYTPITIFDLKTHLDESSEIYSTPVSEPQILSLKQNIEVPKFDENSNSNQFILKESEEKKNINNSAGYTNVEDFLDYKIVGELFNEFLVLEKNDKMLLIDFHAGHERLNYDKLTRMIENRELIVQDLLVPYVQSMSSIEVDFIMELKDDLYNLGFDIERFSDTKIVINSIPMQLKDINLKNFVDDLIHDMKNFRPSMNNEIKHYLMQKACKASVKSGMKLTEMEIKELLKNLDINHPVLLCPHGRPVVTVISRVQIEKWFKRIV